MSRNHGHPARSTRAARPLVLLLGAALAALTWAVADDPKPTRPDRSNRESGVPPNTRPVAAAQPAAPSKEPETGGGGNGSVPGASATEASPSVDDIVNRYVEARGGLKKLMSVQTLRQSGRIMAGANRTAVATRTLKRPGMVRFEFTLQGVTSVYASNGKTGWKSSPFEGDAGPQPMPEVAVADALEQAEIEGPLVDWKAKGTKVEMAGRETIAGRDAYKLQLTFKSGIVAYCYIDSKSYSLLRMDTTRRIHGRPVQVRIIFDDYKKVGGVLFPHRLEMEAVGRPQHLKIVVDKVEVNPKVNDSIFQKPPA